MTRLQIVTLLCASGLMVVGSVFIYVNISVEPVKYGPSLEFDGFLTGDLLASH